MSAEPPPAPARSLLLAWPVWGAAVLAAGSIASVTVLTPGGQERPPRHFEVGPELHAELDPAFDRYLEHGPAARFRVTLLGGRVPVDVIAGARGVEYGVIDTAAVPGTPRFGTVFVDLGACADVLSYRDGYLLIILDSRCRTRFGWEDLRPAP